MLEEFQPLLTRRASRTDRAALRAALDCSVGLAALPTVFASRHGEVHRSVTLLEALARGEALSPTAFSLSVHNAAAGLFSIGRSDRSTSTSIAAGRDSLPMAVLAGCGILGEGAPSVLVVAYDEPVPAPFRPYVEEDAPYAAVALLMEAKGPNPFTLELLPAAATHDAAPGNWLEPLRFLASAQSSELLVNHPSRSWRWRRA